MKEQELLRLPVAVDVPTAGRVLGLSRNTAYRQVRQGTFPLPVIRAGRQYRIPRAAILQMLGMTDPSSSSARIAESNEAAPLAKRVGSVSDPSCERSRP